MVHALGGRIRSLAIPPAAQQSLQANLRLTLTNVNSALVISTLMVIGTAAMYYIGTLHVLDGTLTLGSLLVFSAYLLMLYQPLESLTYTAWAMEGATAGAQRCFEVLDREDDVRDAPDAVAISSAQGAIAFQPSVSVTQATDTSCATSICASNRIKSLAWSAGPARARARCSVWCRVFTIRPRVSSRSTTVTCARSPRNRLRAQIAIVLQDTLLFSTTVRENIAYGRPDATEEEIREAAHRAQADEFIRRMPDGYESAVGERGGHLSVGQRQRIGIARAFLKNAPILLLDEPTSALDPTTEAAIMETIKELMRGRTTLIVTHRLATIHGVDQIIVLEHGRVVEKGRGPELIARGGTYAKLYASGNSRHDADNLTYVVSKC